MIGWSFDIETTIEILQRMKNAGGELIGMKPKLPVKHEYEGPTQFELVFVDTKTYKIVGRESDNYKPKGKNERGLVLIS